MSNIPESRLKHFYINTIVPNMVKEFKYSNTYQVPKILKVVLSMGLGKRDLKKNTDNLTAIACQKAVTTFAKHSISQFSLRQGAEIGARVTLRNKLMHHFLDKFANVALVNWRAFTGFKVSSINGMSKNVSFSCGIPDGRIFPEVKDDSIRAEGLNITIVTNCKSVKECKFLLEQIGLPFKE